MSKPYTIRHSSFEIFHEGKFYLTNKESKMKEYVKKIKK